MVYFIHKVNVFFTASNPPTSTRVPALFRASTGVFTLSVWVSILTKKFLYKCKSSLCLTLHADWGRYNFQTVRQCLKSIINVDYFFLVLLWRDRSRLWWYSCICIRTMQFYEVAIYTSVYEIVRINRYYEYSEVECFFFSIFLCWFEIIFFEARSTFVPNKKN